MILNITNIMAQPSSLQHGSEHVEINEAGNSMLVYRDPEKDVKNPVVQGDYSGAVAKSDPAEIALVRKLDRRILPMLCVMYFLNYVSTTQIVLAC